MNLQKLQTTKPRVRFPDIPNADHQQSFFDDGYFFTVTSERSNAPKPVLVDAEQYNQAFKEEKAWVKDGAGLFNYEYKTVVVRYGQTFAN